MKFIIAYHSTDLDGHLSGALVRYWLEEMEKVKEPIQMVPINYGEPFPYEMLRPEDMLFMVDFALQPIQEMVNLNELCHLHWIDHHLTSLADPKDKGHAWMEGIKGIRSAEGAACELVWKYFWHDPETLVTYPMPNFVQWIGIYDRWDQSDMRLWENMVLPFQFGMKARETDPATDEGYECWRHLLEIKDSEVLRSAVTSIILQGLAVKRYANKENEDFIKGYAFTSTWNGITWLLMNGGSINSAKESSAFDPSVHQGVLSYVNVKGNFWRVSMRTDRNDLDLSALARKFGGGGHRKAAGFQINDLPAELVGPNYGEEDEGQSEVEIPAQKEGAADKGVNLMDIDTRLSNRVKQVVDGTLEPITFNDIFKALLPEGYEMTDIAQAIQSLVEDCQLELDGVMIKISDRRPF